MVANKAQASVLKVQGIAVAVAVVGSYFFGLIANSIWNNEIRCFALGDAGGCSSNNIALYVFGFYLGLIFCISFVHFAFISWSRKYYYIIMAVLLAVGLIDSQLLLLALGYLAVGVIAGMVVNKLKGRSSGQARG